MPSSTSTPRPVMLCILDGWGLSPRTEANAVALGDTPNFDRIWQTCPHTQLIAHGTDVGLPAGVMGNSEVGHLNIGAGRIVWQDSSLIDQEIREGAFFQNETLRAAMQHAFDNNTRLHLMGLVSDGNVHASQGHYFALLEMAARAGLKADQVLFHAFTDGRDVPPRSAAGYIARLIEQMVVTGVGAVASVIGRYYAMDRDNRWERVREAYECLAQGSGHQARGALEAVQNAYARDENDEFIKATVVLDEDGQPRPRIADNDAVIFFNYRSDRGRQLTQCFIDADFDAQRHESQQPGAAAAEQTPLVTKFARPVWPRTRFVTMTRYASSLSCPIAFEPRPQHNGLGETAARAGKRQLRIAETEKYPHVTYFFSGGIEQEWPGETRLLVPSPKVATYDLQPEMNAPQVTAKVTAAIRSEEFDLIILNYANPDMVGHTGILEAAITAVETVDRGLGEVLAAIETVGGALLVIADHGNCEQMIDYETRQPHTAHTTNPVPCILFGQGTAVKLRDGGRLADIAPTLLGLMDLPQPPEMSGIDLRQTAPAQLVDVRVVATGDEAAQALETALNTATKVHRFYLMAAATAENSFAGIGARTLLRELAADAGKLMNDLQDRLNGGGDEDTKWDRSTANLAEGVSAVAGDHNLNSVLAVSEILGAALDGAHVSGERFAKLAADAQNEAARAIFRQVADVAKARESALSQAMKEINPA